MDDIPYMTWKMKFMFETTNQYSYHQYKSAIDLNEIPILLGEITIFPMVFSHQNRGMILPALRRSTPHPWTAGDEKCPLPHGGPSPVAPGHQLHGLRFPEKKCRVSEISKCHVWLKEGKSVVLVGSTIYITLSYVTLRCVALRYVTFYYITLHYIHCYTYHIRYI